MKVEIFSSVIRSSFSFLLKNQVCILMRTITVVLAILLSGCLEIETEETTDEANTTDTDTGTTNTDTTTDTDTTDTDTDTGTTDTVTDDDTSTDTLAWPIEDGRFGVAEEVLVLPPPNNQNAMHIPDVQASYPDVNWNTLDRLYIQAGQYAFIRLGNLPIRSPDDPLIITNKDGQVRVGGLNHYYLFSIGGGANWVLTGRYDPESGTGHEDYPGHRGGNFANSRDSYGILVDDDYLRDGNSGIAIGSSATDFELEYIEVREVGFAGITIKTDDIGSAHMRNVKLHDLYIHDTGSEGLYLGSTQAQPQHKLIDWEIYNNRVLRTGTEAIQMGQMSGSNTIRNNIFGPAAMDWRAAFQNYQDFNFQIGLREGLLRVENNIFLGAAGQIVSFFAHDVAGDSTDTNVGAQFYNNYFEGMRSLGMYINSTALEGMSYEFVDNTFGGFRFLRDEVYDVEPYNHLLRIFNSTTPITLTGNTWSGPERLSIEVENNGTEGNHTATNNVNEEPEKILFVDSGLPDNFDWLTIEMWTETATLGNNQPVDYELDDYVTHLGIPYRCRIAVCTSGLIPTDSPDAWEALPYLADDVRVRLGTTWEHLGLQPN